jgi:coenzyme F420-dependent glucose-6-phosphate dehydrogenase
MRIHPAILAQAAATTSLLLPGRFVWGVGSGEALNEHVLGDRWPPAPVRIERLAEAIEVIRRLWTEESVTHRGTHFTVEDARIFDRPDEPPPIIVSAYGDVAAGVAADHGDGLWVGPNAAKTVERFRQEGGSGPVYTQIAVCWSEDAQDALETALRLWPNTAVPGQLSQDLPTVQHFEEATRMVTSEIMASQVPMGSDPEPYVEAARHAVDAGADHIYFHQIGPDQEGFAGFWDKELREVVAGLAE